MVVTRTCKSIVLTLIGGKSSNTKEKTSSTFRTKRFLMFHQEEMLKAKQLLSGIDITEPTKDGELFILTNLRR
jgi:hypothetical protein